jgi:hypothetical protein
LYLVFVGTELLLRPTGIKYLGLTLAIIVPLCLLARLPRPNRAGVSDRRSYHLSGNSPWCEPRISRDGL